MDIETEREKIRGGYYQRYRRPEIKGIDLESDAERENIKGLPLHRSESYVYRRILEQEKPVVFPDERIIFTRTLGKYTVENNILPLEFMNRKPRWNRIENLTPGWGRLISEGLLGRRTAALESLKKHKGDAEAEDYLTATVEMIDSVEVFAKRYADAACTPEQRALLERVPLHPARTFHEALQSIRFVSSIMRLFLVAHIGFGRFDQYMLPLYRADIASGRLTREEAADLLAEFFCSLNRDSDLYHGVQKGDNGQSLMLGGCDKDGKSAVNELTQLVLEVSESVNMIDPKINLRVDSSTPEDILLAAAKLTRRGLGFPQYCNDEKVIPSLVKFGYPLELARDYTVAACWEYVLDDGRDTPNYMTMNFPRAADEAIREGLRAGDDFDGILRRIPETMRRQQSAMRKQIENPIEMLPELMTSALAPHAIEKGRDLNRGGGSHYHYGCHGPGSSSAADALAAVKYLVFEKKTVSRERLLAGLESNFENDPELVRMLKEVPHKAGSGDSYADDFMILLFDTMADVLAELADPWIGGRVRPGTGSAQNYVLLTQKNYPGALGATADGRREGDYISSSLSPAPGVRSKGILSVLTSYGKLPYEKLCNGGPITMELAPCYFKTEDALHKAVRIIRDFVRTGCQQLQINLLDPVILRDAQIHPENHRDLIVRVWGWSGYFVELSKEYQDQIIERQCFKG